MASSNFWKCLRAGSCNSGLVWLLENTVHLLTAWADWRPEQMSHFQKKKDVVSDSLEVLMKHLVGFSVSKAVCRTGHTELQWDHPDFLDGRNEPRSAPWRSAQRGREVSASCFRGAVAQGCAVSEGSPISLSYQICRSLAVCAVQRIQVVVRGGFFMDITEKAGIYFEVG